MAALRHVFEALGFSDVETHFTSGNVVFDSSARDTKRLERRIETRLREALRRDVATLVRLT